MATSSQPRPTSQRRASDRVGPRLTGPSPEKCPQNEACLVLGTFTPPTQAQIQAIKDILADDLNVVVGIHPGPTGKMDFGLAKQNVNRTFGGAFMAGRIHFVRLPSVTEIFHGRGSRIRIRRQ